MEIFGLTDQGRVRKLNQDAVRTSYDEAQNAALLVVCDGMGGAKAGNVASELAADTFFDDVWARMSGGVTILEVTDHMRTAVDKANAIVYEKSLSDPDCAGMGTTIVAAAVLKAGAVVLNIGDSRAYHVTGGEIGQITKDHSVVEDMIDRGDLTRSEASAHPNRNLITRALGTSPETQPDFFIIELTPGDHLLLCSDGLSNVVPEHKLLEELGRGQGAEQTCRRLIELAVENGAPDNVTAALLTK